MTVINRASLRVWNQRVAITHRYQAAEAHPDEVHDMLAAPTDPPGCEWDSAHRSQWLWISTPFGLMLALVPHGNLMPEARYDRIWDEIDDLAREEEYADI